MINITFPDKSVKNFDNNPSGMGVAESISQGFARNCVAMKTNGVLRDLNQIIEKDCDISFITAKDEQGLEFLRHSSAHVMAEAGLNI